jgi:hypothetical protein
MAARRSTKAKYLLRASRRARLRADNPHVRPDLNQTTYLSLHDLGFWGPVRAR